jgi:CRP-like cAMP-binding protein
VTYRDKDLVGVLNPDKPVSYLVKSGHLSLEVPFGEGNCALVRIAGPGELMGVEVLADPSVLRGTGDRTLSWVIRAVGTAEVSPLALSDMLAQSHLREILAQLSAKSLASCLAALSETLAYSVGRRKTPAARLHRGLQVLARTLGEERDGEYVFSASNHLVSAASVLAEETVRRAWPELVKRRIANRERNRAGHTYYLRYKR